MENLKLNKKLVNYSSLSYDDISSVDFFVISVLELSVWHLIIPQKYREEIYLLTAEYKLSKSAVWWAVLVSLLNNDISFILKHATSMYRYQG